MVDGLGNRCSIPWATRAGLGRGYRFGRTCPYLGVRVGTRTKLGVERVRAPTTDPTGSHQSRSNTTPCPYVRVHTRVFLRICAHQEHARDHALK